MKVEPLEIWWTDFLMWALFPTPKQGSLYLKMRISTKLWDIIWKSIDLRLKWWEFYCIDMIYFNGAIGRNLLTRVFETKGQRSYMGWRVSIYLFENSPRLSYSISTLLQFTSLNTIFTFDIANEFFQYYFPSLSKFLTAFFQNYQEFLFARSHTSIITTIVKIIRKWYFI